jgi:hypothetical protein
MDFLYFLLAVLLGLFLMGSVLVLRIRKGKKPIAMGNIAAGLAETKDDPDEPARWVP